LASRTVPEMLAKSPETKSAARCECPIPVRAQIKRSKGSMLRQRRLNRHALW
jgi:hypothetical protein